jgi:flagellar protein FlaG
MSSNQITAVQHSEVVSLHGPRPTERSLETLKAGEPEDVKRSETASHGQNLPSGKIADAEHADKVESAVSKISDFVQNFQRDLRFSIDKESDRLVVKVLDSETQEVIRQIPSEETLRIARNLDSPGSLILREQA